MLTITEPAKLRAAATCNAASDHFDDAPLVSGTGMGNTLSIGLRSALEPASSTSVAAPAHRPSPPPAKSGRPARSSASIWPNARWKSLGKKRRAGTSATSNFASPTWSD